MEYGSILFVNDPKATIILLERVQNLSVRLALGGAKTTSIPVVQFGTKIPPLFLRKLKLA